MNVLRLILNWFLILTIPLWGGAALFFIAFFTSRKEWLLERFVTGSHSLIGGGD